MRVLRIGVFDEGDEKMPTFSDISHVSLSVRDAEETAQWWQEVFGLEQVFTVEEDTWHAVLLGLTKDIALEFQQHNANSGEAFDPVRTGFDHMGLKVDSRGDLNEWQAHFERLGVIHTPVVDRDYGSVLTFKDPDGIQFEMFYETTKQ
jgi:glyoxylase I family protein